MSDHDAILHELNKMNNRLSAMETTLSAIAVQEEKISAMRMQIDALWRKFDAAFSPEGTIAKLQATQAGCPKNEVKAAISRQWAAIATIVAMITALKLWG